MSAAPKPTRHGAALAGTSTSVAASRPVRRLSIHGHATTSANAKPGSTIPGQNTGGIGWPKIFHSIAGPRRSAPSSQPAYQSGVAGFVMT